MPDAPEKPPAEPGDLTGRVLGEFEILRRLGAGGMGQVYLARQLSLKRQVALKLLHDNLTGNPTALKRFQAEAEAVARLNHPNIVQVYGAGESDGLRYMALEYVDGRNLREHLARKGPPDLPIALSIMRQIATALQKAHEQGLVHRDIKPENILVTRRVEVKVTDFGLSRFFADGEGAHLTQSGITVGTPLYLSPEQAQGKPVDHRSDVYSFGVTCYHLLTGELPFRGATALEVALKHLTDHPRPIPELRPDLPADLCGMVHKMMAKAPADRYQSAREILRDLARVRDGLGAGAGAGALGPAASVAGLATVSGLAASGLAGSGPTPLSPTPTLGLTSADDAPAARPVPRWWWAAGAGACLLAAVGGAAAYLGRHPAPEPVAAPARPPAPPGLPDVHPPAKPTTPRERELLDLVRDRHTAPDRWIAASIELGLLYLREGRADEAHFAGRLGRAVVTAYRDADPRHPRAARESVDQFAKAFANPFPKTAKTDRPDLARSFLVRHPDLAQAVAEALTRDAANIAPDKLPADLDALRTPRGVTKKD